MALAWVAGFHDRASPGGYTTARSADPASTVREQKCRAAPRGLHLFDTDQLDAVEGTKRATALHPR